MYDLRLVTGFKLVGAGWPRSWTDGGWADIASNHKSHITRHKLFVVAAVVRDFAAFLAVAVAEQAAALLGAVRVALDLFLGLGGVAGERHGQEALLGDRFLGRLADAVGAVVDA